MGNFPKKENDVVALAKQMIAGYTAHPVDFPSIDPLTDLVALQAALDAYQADRESQIDARSQAKLATETKETKLGDLVETMKNDLKLSEVDTAADPTKLAEIGWSAKRPAQSPKLADPPGNLTATTQSNGMLELSWGRPANSSIRNYIVESRKLSEPFGNWQMAGTSLSEQITLTGQPQRKKLEYRVKAVNLGGQSSPSNSVTVVL